MPAKSRLETSQPIGIIAGSGALFSMVWNQVLALGLQPVVITFKGAGHPFHDDHTPCLHTTLGKIGEILNFLKSHGVKQLIFAGRIARPTFSSLSFDTVGLRWMQKLGKALTIILVLQELETSIPSRLQSVFLAQI